MSRQSKSTVKKPVVVKMRKSHRMMVCFSFAFLSICMLASMISVISSSEFGLGINFMLLAIATIPFLPLPLYYTSWQITFDADGIQKQLFWIRQKQHPWTQVEEVRCAWLISERGLGLSIQFKDGKTIRFRMDCDNAEHAKKMILSHCSISEHGTPYA